jgi:hypothetical protein
VSNSLNATVMYAVVQYILGTVSCIVRFILAVEALHCVYTVGAYDTILGMH